MKGACVGEGGGFYYNIAECVGKFNVCSKLIEHNVWHDMPSYYN